MKISTLISAALLTIALAVPTLAATPTTSTAATAVTVGQGPASSLNTPNRADPGQSIKAMSDAANKLANEGLTGLAQRVRKIARELRRDGDCNKAKRELKRACQAAAQQGASEEAIRLLDQAINALN